MDGSERAWQAPFSCYCSSRELCLPLRLAAVLALVVEWRGVVTSQPKATASWWRPADNATASGTRLRSESKNSTALFIDCSSQLASKMPLFSGDGDHCCGPLFQGPMALLAIVADLAFPAFPSFPAYSLFFLPLSANEPHQLPPSRRLRRRPVACFGELFSGRASF